MAERRPLTPEAVIEALLGGTLMPEEALAALRNCDVEDLGFARIDQDRARRRGFPEAIYGPGKRPEQVHEIFTQLAARNPNVICTRASPRAADRVLKTFSEAEYEPHSRLLWLWRNREVRGLGEVLVISAGTSDSNIAFEALQAARVMGNRAELLVDVGVAGLHRLLQHCERLRQARIIIAVAGFDAALPAVVAGLVDRPVIAVPTRVGYGASFHGLAALLAALNSCSDGVVTVNIDNGYGAARAATLMNRA